MLMDDDSFTEQLAEQDKQGIFQKRNAVTGNRKITEIKAAGQKNSEELEKQREVTSQTGKRRLRMIQVPRQYDVKIGCIKSLIDQFTVTYFLSDNGCSVSGRRQLKQKETGGEYRSTVKMCGIFQGTKGMETGGSAKTSKTCYFILSVIKIKLSSMKHKDCFNLPSAESMT